jgi:hypothetical protein
MVLIFSSWVEKKESNTKDYRPDLLKKLDGAWKAWGQIIGDSVQ